MHILHDGRRTESRFSHWTYTAAVMGNVLKDVLRGVSVPALPGRPFEDAVRLLGLALEGFPYISGSRSDVYMTVRCIGMFREKADQEVVFNLNCWKNILEVANAEGYGRIMPEHKGHLEEMRKFFELVQNIGAQENRHLEDVLDDLG